MSAVEKLQKRIGLYEVNEDGTLTYTADPKTLVHLNSLVESATEDVRRARWYPKTWTDDEVKADLESYEGTIVDLAFYDYVTEGGEYEESHSENSVSRTFIDRKSLLNGVPVICH